MLESIGGSVNNIKDLQNKSNITRSNNTQNVPKDVNAYNAEKNLINSAAETKAVTSVNLNIDGPPKTASSKIMEKGENYAISGESVVIKTGDKNVEKAINSQIKELINSKITSFKNDIGQDPGNNEFTITAKAEAAQKILTVNFSEYSYSAGAAHGNSASSSATFSLEKGNMIGLSDLFKPNSTYLQKMSDYCAKELSSAADDAMVLEGKEAVDAAKEAIKEGTSPKAENFKCFNIGEEGIKVTFNPYQVGSYADGASEVTVPYHVLINDIPKSSPLFNFLNEVQQMKMEQSDLTNFNKQMSGLINGKYKIEMEVKSDGPQLTGKYKYANQNEYIQLKGTIDNNGVFTMAEFDKKGVQTGVFKGKFEDGSLASGTWSRPNGEKTMPFELSGIY